MWLPAGLASGPTRTGSIQVSLNKSYAALVRQKGGAHGPASHRNIRCRPFPQGCCLLLPGWFRNLYRRPKQPARRIPVHKVVTKAYPSIPHDYVDVIPDLTDPRRQNTKAEGNFLRFEQLMGFLQESIDPELHVLVASLNPLNPISITSFSLRLIASLNPLNRTSLFQSPDFLASLIEKGCGRFHRRFLISFLPDADSYEWRGFSCSSSCALTCAIDVPESAPLLRVIPPRHMGERTDPRPADRRGSPSKSRCTTISSTFRRRWPP